MLILGLDTSAAESTVWLAKNEVIIAEERNANQKNHASSINQMIHGVLNSSGYELQQVAAVSVIGGPGSYTGLRVGLATAKGICFALNKPLIQHNYLELMALQMVHEFRNDYDWYGVLLKARAKEFFFTLANDTGRLHQPPIHILEDNLCTLLVTLHGRLLLLGDIDETGISSNNLTITQGINLDIRHWGRAAFDALLQKEFADIAMTEPYYLKAPFTHK